MLTIPLLTIPLPDRPSLEQLRNQAKDLRRSVRARLPEALAEVAQRARSGLPSDDVIGSFPLSTAQSVVARRYGFASWTRLKRQVEVVERYSRFPRDLAKEDGAGELGDPGDPGSVELLVSAGFDVNARGRIDLPRDDPWETGLHRAAKSGDVELARTLLALGADPDLHAGWSVLALSQQEGHGYQRTRDVDEEVR
jgi:hypothetical protein